MYPQMCEKFTFKLSLYQIFFNEHILSIVIKHIIMTVIPSKIYLFHIYLCHYFSPLMNNKICPRKTKEVSIESLIKKIKI